MTMLAAAAAMWLLTAILALTARRRASQLVLISTALMSIAQTLSINPVYLAVDAFLPGANLTMLIGDLVRIAAISVLVVAIIAATGRSTPLLRPIMWASAGAVGAIMIVSFVLIDAPEPAGSFMLTYGDQPAAAVFNAAQMSYIAVATGVAGWHLAAVFRRVRDRWFRVSLALLLAGSACGIGFGSTAVIMDIAHLAGDIDTMRGGGRIYDLLLTLAVVVLLCAGFAMLPVARRLAARRRAVQVEGLSSEITAIWARVVPEHLRHRFGFEHADAEMMLHRQLIEIEDALLDPDVTIALTDLETVTVESAHARIAALSGTEERA